LLVEIASCVGLLAVFAVMQVINCFLKIIGLTLAIVVFHDVFQLSRADFKDLLLVTEIYVKIFPSTRSSWSTRLSLLPQHNWLQWHGPRAQILCPYQLILIFSERAFSTMIKYHSIWFRNIIIGRLHVIYQLRSLNYLKFWKNANFFLLFLVTICHILPRPTLTTKIKLKTYKPRLCTLNFKEGWGCDKCIVQKYAKKIK